MIEEQASTYLSVAGATLKSLCLGSAFVASSYPPAAALALPQCGKHLCQDYSEEERSDRWEHLVGQAFSTLFDMQIF